MDTFGMHCCWALQLLHFFVDFITINLDHRLKFKYLETTKINIAL